MSCGDKGGWGRVRGRARSSSQSGQWTADEWTALAIREPIGVKAEKKGKGTVVRVTFVRTESVPKAPARRLRCAFLFDLLFLVLFIFNGLMIASQHWF